MKYTIFVVSDSFMPWGIEKQQVGSYFNLLHTSQDWNFIELPSENIGPGSGDLKLSGLRWHRAKALHQLELYPESRARSKIDMYYKK